MFNVCVFAGTTEGRELVEYLDSNRIRVTACVATEYGEEVMPDTKAIIHVGRLDYDDMLDFFGENEFDIVVDATHPYAAVVTQNVVAACEKLSIRYLRLNRELCSLNVGIHFDNIDKAVEYLSKTSGNILLTTGSKELSKFTKIASFKERIYLRVLPLEESLRLCKENGYDSSHIIAMQGPFSEEINVAIMKAYDIKYLVTKESGTTGGYVEKIYAANSLGVECIIINRPKTNFGYSYEEIISILGNASFSSQTRDGSSLKKELARNISLEKRKINIVGMGVGSFSQMTVEAGNILKKSDVIIGAKRILESCVDFYKPVHCAFMADEVLEYVNNHKEYKNIAIVMSGDVGFYSGTKKLIEVLKDYEINIVCGISSPVYLCSKLGISWENISLYSLHGRENNIIYSIKTNFRTFTLVGGDYGVNDLCRLLCKYDFNDVKLYIGERLSYRDEKITIGAASELIEHTFDKLASVIIENSSYTTKLNVGIDDEEFERTDKVPMTKSEVRAVSIGKLKLSQDSIVYDIGAGSGSVSIEAALCSYRGTVYAIEKKHEAAILIEKNKIKFGVSNINVIEGIAPEAMEGLPMPTHAFIGGSTGNLSDIIEKLIEKNKNVKIVINAVTLETISEVLECFKKFDCKDAEIINLTVSKSKKLGNYNMMMGQNPIYIIVCK